MGQRAYSCFPKFPKKILKFRQVKEQFQHFKLLGGSVMFQKLVSSDTWLHSWALEITYVELWGFAVLKVKSSRRLVLVYRVGFFVCSC